MHTHSIFLYLIDLPATSTQALLLLHITPLPPTALSHTTIDTTPAPAPLHLHADTSPRKSLRKGTNTYRTPVAFPLSLLLFILHQASDLLILDLCSFVLLAYAAQHSPLPGLYGARDVP